MYTLLLEIGTYHSTDDVNNCMFMYTDVFRYFCYDYVMIAKVVVYYDELFIISKSTLTLPYGRRSTLIFIDCSAQYKVFQKYALFYDKPIHLLKCNLASSCP